MTAAYYRNWTSATRVMTSDSRYAGRSNLWSATYWRSVVALRSVPTTACSASVWCHIANRHVMRRAWRSSRRWRCGFRRTMTIRVLQKPSALSCAPDGTAYRRAVRACQPVIIPLMTAALGAPAGLRRLRQNRTTALKVNEQTATCTVIKHRDGAEHVYRQPDTCRPRELAWRTEGRLHVMQGVYNAIILRDDETDDLDICLPR